MGYGARKNEIQLHAYALSSELSRGVAAHIAVQRLKPLVQHDAAYRGVNEHLALEQMLVAMGTILTPEQKSSLIASYK